MQFHQLSKFARFTIADEPESIFYKDANRWDGAINAYRIMNKYGDTTLKPVTFERTYPVQVIKDEDLDNSDKGNES